MNHTSVPEKWIIGLDADAPVTAAAQRVLERRLSAVDGILKDVVKSKAEDDEAVHALRVSTRRAEAALLAFKPWLRRERRKAAKKTMQRLRTAAGLVRMCDVHRTLLVETLVNQDSDDRLAVEAAMVMLDADRQTALHELLDVARKARRTLDDVERRWTRRPGVPPSPTTATIPGPAPSATADDETPPTLRAAGDAALRDLARTLRTLAAGDLMSREHLHRLRVQGKRLRYAIEIFGATAGDPESLAHIGGALIDVQERLGLVNDCHEVAERLARYAVSAGAAIGAEAARPGQNAKRGDSSLSLRMESLADQFEKRCNQSASEFRHWRASEESAEVRRLIAELAGEGPPAPTESEPAPAEVVVVAHRNGAVDTEAPTDKSAVALAAAAPADEGHG